MAKIFANNVGSTRITATYKDGNVTVTDFVDIRVIKTAGYLKAAIYNNRTFNGSEQDIAIIESNTGNYYFGIGSSDKSAPTTWGPANTKLQATNAGTYYVWAKCDESTNYEAVAAKYIGTVIISKLEAELSWGDSNWIYDGDSHQTICTVSNLVEGDECDVILKNNVISNIDSIDVEVIELTNSNYKLPNNTKHTITISPGFFIKQSGNWFPVKKVYKRVSGTWVLQDMQSETRKSVFDVNKNYVNSENL